MVVVALAEVRRPVVGATTSGATGRRAPKSESERLVESRMPVLMVIAERFSELTDPLAGPSGVRGSGEAIGLMPHDADCLIRASSPARCTCAYRSVVEFSRLALQMRAKERQLWWHLDGWFLSAESRTMWLCPRCGPCHQPEHRHPNRRSGRLSTVKCKRVVIRSRRSGAREATAKEALTWIAERWGLESEPMLPEEYRRVA